MESIAPGAILDQQDLRAIRGQLEQFDDMFVVKPYAAVGRAAADFAGVVGSVDAVGRPAQIQRPNSQGVFGRSTFN